MENAYKIIGGGKPENRKPMDFYPTPPEVTHALIDHLERHALIGSRSVVLEPACGDGDMAEVITGRGYYCRATDIRHTEYADRHEGGGLDFLDDTWFAGLDWIITNPPFNVSAAFIDRCLAYKVMFALLLKSQYWHSAKRNNLFYERKPMFVCPLSWRPKFHSGSPLMDFIWTIWGREDGDTRYIPLKKPEGF